MIAAKVKNLKQEVAAFEQTNLKKSLIQIFNTIVPYIALWLAAYASLAVSYWLALPFIIMAAGFLIRTFIIFHDCCHQSFFKSRRANDLIGTMTGVLTHIPYRQWKHEHTVHHATSGNLSKRGSGDIWILTVKEYAAAKFWTRISYRIYRNPLVMFGIGPIAIFLIKYRFNRKGAPRKERINTWITSLLIVGLYTVLCELIGWQALLAIQGPIFMLSGMFGIWLFYVQHQFEDSYFEPSEEWDYVKAAVEGSSYYKLPRPAQWITGNIGLHHVHHLNSKVPNYNLESAHHATPILQTATTITLFSSLRALRFKLWDETGKAFMSFKEARPLIRNIRAGLASSASATADKQPHKIVSQLP